MIRKLMENSTAILKFRNTLEQIRREEIDRYKKKLNAQQLFLIEQLSQSMMQRVMNVPVFQLKKTANLGKTDRLCDGMNVLFTLE